MALIDRANRASSSSVCPGPGSGTRASRSPSAIRSAVAAVAATGRASVRDTTNAAATPASAVPTPATTNQRPAAPKSASTVSVSSTARGDGSPAAPTTGAAA